MDCCCVRWSQIIHLHASTTFFSDFMALYDAVVVFVSYHRGVLAMHMQWVTVLLLVHQGQCVVVLVLIIVACWLCTCSG